MQMQHIAAFSIGDTGGNPAGVVLCDSLPGASFMQAAAADAGYSECVFAAPDANGWKVRYFAPAIEVEFCGHATIALGAALAMQAGPGVYPLEIAQGTIEVEGYASGARCGAAFRSLPTRSRPLTQAVLGEVLALFGLGREALDPRLPAGVAHAGEDHLILALRDRATLRAMRYDFERGRALAQREGLVTFDLVHAESPRLFHARNPFPLGGVYEDPATGAAAGALAGYLRDLGWPHEGAITILQGEDMGVPCRIEVDIPPRRGEGVRVAGTARILRAPRP
jgi:PhzF family phenazine biosynthesis protein